MHRAPLLDILADYERRYPEEAERTGRIRRLVREHVDCFERSCLPGHVTASALVLSPDRERFLLTHHRKLDRWLQLGGHADGDCDVRRVARREAREESGIQELSWLTRAAGEASDPTPIDVDVHRIPERPGEPCHDHHDIRFVLVASCDGPLAVSDESVDLRWFRWGELDELGADESLLRLARKARELIADTR